MRSLITAEGLPPDRIVVVVNEEGGLDDPHSNGRCAWSDSTNSGPGGGFKVGLEVAFEDPESHWAYLCEDDVGLLPLPSPRLSALVDRVEALGGADPPIGAVVSYGRVLARAPATLRTWFRTSDRLRSFTRLTLLPGEPH